MAFQFGQRLVGASQGGNVNTTSPLSSFRSQVNSAGGVDAVNNSSFSPMRTPTYQGLDTLGSKGIWTPTQLSGDQLNRLDTSGIEAIKGRALGTGPSPWLNMQLQKQGIEEAQQMDSASQTAASQAAAARNMLARTGGLRGGAAERLGAKSADAALLARQDVLRQGALNRANLGIEDERTKTDLLKMLPGAQLANANYQSSLDLANMGAANQAGQFNAAAIIADLGQRNQSNMTGYQEQMKGYAAGQTADEIAKGGKGSKAFFGGSMKKVYQDIPNKAGRWAKGISAPRKL